MDLTGINVPQKIETENNHHIGKKVETQQQTKVRLNKKQSRVNDALKGKAQKSTGRTGGRNFKNQKHLDIMSFNADAESGFIEVVRVLIEKNRGNPVNISVVYQEASYELDVSPSTVKRYLVKHSAMRAELRVFGKAVMLNPNYTAPAEESDEDE
jgi:hypothetical protein